MSVKEKLIAAFKKAIKEKKRINCSVVHTPDVYLSILINDGWLELEIVSVDEKPKIKFNTLCEEISQEETKEIYGEFQERIKKENEKILDKFLKNGKQF